MNDTDILLARQNDCELVLSTGGSGFPKGAKVFYGGGKTVDITNLTNGTAAFARATINVDWGADFPNLTVANGMFYGCTGLASFSGGLPELTSRRQHVLKLP